MSSRFSRRAVDKLLAIVLLTSVQATLHAQESVEMKEFSADIVRVLSKDIFDLNSVPFMQPMVETFNASANAGFYTNAAIPTGDTFYINVRVRGMFGVVRNDKRTFHPGIPTEATDNDVVDALALFIANRIKSVFKRGIDEDSIHVPERSATVLGNMSSEFELNNDYLLRELKNDPAYMQALKLGLDSTLLDKVILGLPKALALPRGADISTIVAMVPQVEVGALYGTELLVRYIPPIRLDTNVGTFTMWGLGLRHNVSRYITDAVDLAMLVAYQKTELENTVGVTGARLHADASTYNATLSGSRRFGNGTVYSGLGVESTVIDMVYRFVLPRELQAQLGLITPKDLNNDGAIDDDEYVADPENGFPGDTKPQTSGVSLTDAGLNFTIGGEYRLGPVAMFADLKLGSFNVVSGGVSISF